MRRSVVVKGLLVAAATVLAALLWTDRSIAGKGGKGDPPPDADWQVVYRESKSASFGNIRVTTADGSQSRDVFVDLPAAQPKFTPDGTRISFLVDTVGKFGVDVRLFTVNLDGTDLTEVVALNIKFNWPEYDHSWSRVAAPDGQFKIALTEADESDPWGQQDIWTCNADGTNVQNLTATPGPWEQNPSFSPDAARIVFRRSSPAGNDLIVAALGQGADGGLIIVHEASITKGVPGSPLADTVLGSCNWSRSDANVIVVQAMRDDGIGHYDVWLIDLTDPANPINLTDDPTASQRDPELSPDGSKVLYTEAGGLVEKDLSTGSTFVLAPGGKGRKRGHGSYR